ncbi:MAG: hypothetical protein K0Q72_5013 [Armatimonadetes bacterium]|nr:hypothetical protein [Armatimonadota bacterium]
MNADCGFRLGSRHTVCQDYAVAGGGGAAYVILADGCSSSPDTDIGARLVVKAAERQFLESGDLPDPERVIRQALPLAADLGLAPECLDATLLSAVVTGDQWSAALCGDGVLAWQDRQGRIHVRSVSYSGGYPDYPSYLCDAARRRTFEALPDNRRTVERWVLEPSGQAHQDPASCSASGAYRESGSVAEVAWLALLSDGAASFLQRPREGDGTARPVSLPDVLRELLAFKSFPGVFVQRRLARFAQRCAERAWSHQDDLSLAAIRIGG